MNYLQLLTKEEKTALCSIIGGKEFREVFKRNEKEFIKIKKGFRAKSLADDVALTTAIINIDKPFVSFAVNARVDIWIKQIQENIALLEGRGAPHETALATTLIDSFFANNIELYFTLTEQPIEEAAKSMLREKMESIRIEREKSSLDSDRITALEEEKAHLVEQIDTAQRSVEATRQEYEQKFERLGQEKRALEAELIDTQKKVTEMQASPSDENSDGFERLATFDDSNPSALPSIDDEQIVSLCGISIDYIGQKWLIRYADLSYTGEYYIFHRSEDNPPFFTNRDKLFYKDGPSDEGFCGVWTWSTVPNAKDPTKDYVMSQFNKGITPIEVVTLTDASSVEELVAFLKDGIEYKPCSYRVMFAYYASNGNYVGILCNSKGISTVNGITAFTDDFVTAPVYEFTSVDTIRLDNGVSFYRKSFAGIPTRLYQIKSSIEIVKSIVWKSLSWSTYKSRGFIRSNYRAFKDFISAIPTNDIIGQIQVACHCSASAAEVLLSGFLETVNKYLDGDVIDDEIVLSAILASSVLQEKTKDLLRADWEAENEAQIAEARDKVSGLESRLTQINTALEEAQTSYTKVKQDEARISGLIAEKEQLAGDVEAIVAQRIEHARSNAAEFIANMAFSGSQPVQMPTKGSEPAPVPAIIQYRVVDAAPNQDELETHDSWSAVIDTTAFELDEAGVAKQYARGLSAFLCSAYIDKQPILLVGPNAIDIVQAFSAAVSARKYGVLNCNGEFSNQVIDSIGAQGETIVLINNLLAGGWLNRLPEILSRKGIFFIATHPYAEDIQVEPKSMYSFMLPLFTEFLVDRKATGKYSGGRFTQTFKGYVPSKGSHKEIKALSRFAMNALIRNRISSLVSIMHEINSESTVDDDFMLAILPFAYATMTFDALTESVSDMQRSVPISTSLRRDLQYILGDAK